MIIKTKYIIQSCIEISKQWIPNHKNLHTRGRKPVGSVTWHMEFTDLNIQMEYNIPEKERVVGRVSIPTEEPQCWPLSTLV
jgi:hypothetical protein